MKEQSKFSFRRERAKWKFKLRTRIPVSLQWVTYVFEEAPDDSE